MRLVLVDNASAEGVEPFRSVAARTRSRPQSRPAAVRRQYEPRSRGLDGAVPAVLNTDMLFDPPAQCLARMVEFMDAQPDCGVSGCRLYHEDGRDAFAARRFQTLPIILARRCGWGPCCRASSTATFTGAATRGPRSTAIGSPAASCWRGGGAGRRGPLRRALRQVLRGRRHLSPHAPGRLAGHVPRRNVLLPPGTAGQRAAVFRRCLAAPAGLCPLAPQMGLPAGWHWLCRGAAVFLGGTRLAPRARITGGKKVTGTICRNGPEGASHKWCLSPFSHKARARPVPPRLGGMGWFLSSSPSAAASLAFSRRL